MVVNMCNVIFCRHCITHSFGLYLRRRRSFVVLKRATAPDPSHSALPRDPGASPPVEEAGEVNGEKSTKTRQAILAHTRSSRHFRVFAHFMIPLSSLFLSSIAISSSMAKAELSEYEEQRKANIAERDALLRKLALDAADAGLGPTRTKQSANGVKPPKKKSHAKKPKEDNTPRRTSSRIAGLEADSEKAKRKAEEEYDAAQEAARIKRLRVSGDLQLKDIVVAGQEWSRCEGLVGGVIRRGATPYERTFGDTEVRATPDKQLKALRERMSSLELYEDFEPNSKLRRGSASGQLAAKYDQGSRSLPNAYTRSAFILSQPKRWCSLATNSGTWEYSTPRRHLTLEWAAGG